MEPDNTPQENQPYDNIFKENIAAIFLPLLNKLMGIKIVAWEELKDNQHTTIKREPDFIRKVITDTGKQFILHLEFQSSNDPKMIYRINEYQGILLKKLRLPIKHFVIYLGKDKPYMKTKLKQEDIFTGFELINIWDFNYTQLLSSQIPEEILLAILCDFKKEQTELVIRSIIKKLKQVSNNTNDLKIYIKQLILLSNLRNLRVETIKISDDMPLDFYFDNEEEDILYKRGLNKGVDIGVEKGINLQKEEQEKAQCQAIKMAYEEGLSVEQIAKVFSIAIEQVKEVLTEK